MPPAQTHVPVQLPQDWPQVDTRFQLLNVDPGSATAALKAGDRQHVGDDGMTYVCVDPTVPAVWIPTASAILWQWSGQDAVQFGPAVAFGGATNPQLTFVPDAMTVGGGYLEVSLGLGSPPGAGALWPITSLAIEYLSMRLRWLQSVAPDAVIVPPDDLFAGMFFAGDPAASLGISALSGTDSAGADFFAMGASNGASPAFSLNSMPLTPSPFRINELEINAQRMNPGGFPPDGVPTFIGTARSTQNPPAASADGAFFCPPTQPFDPAWGASPLNTAGIVALTIAGNAGNSKLRLGMLSIERSLRGYP